MSSSERADLLPAAIRFALILAFVALVVWLGLTRPVVLVCGAVVLAGVLAVTKILGDLMWEDDGSPRSGTQRQAGKVTTGVLQPKGLRDAGVLDRPTEKS